MIQVVGASGQCGGALLRLLRQDGLPVRALTRGRDPAARERIERAGAQVFVGDLLDPGTLRGLFDGVDRAFLVTTPQHGFDEEVAAGLNFIAAARAQGLRHLVFLSVLYAETDTPHCATKGRIEAALRASAVPFTILRAGYFLDSLPNYFQREWIARGRLESVLDPATRIHWIAIDDIATAAARVLVRDRPENRTYDLVSPEACSMNDVAALVAAHLGRPLNCVHTPLSIGDLLRGLVTAGYASAAAVEDYLRRIPDQQADYHAPITRSNLQVDPQPLTREFGLRFRAPLDFLRQLLQEGRIG